MKLDLKSNISIIFRKLVEIKRLKNEVFGSARNYSHNFICGDHDGHGDAQF